MLLKGDDPLEQLRPPAMLHLLNCIGHVRVGNMCLVFYQHNYVIFPLHSIFSVLRPKSVFVT